MPFLGLLVCLLFLLARLLAFLALIQNVAGRIRVDTLLSDLGKVARRALSRHSPVGRGRQVDVLDATPVMEDGAAVVRYRGDTGQIVGIDVARAERMAARSGVEVVVQVRVGDGIAPGARVALVAAGSVVERFDRCVLLHRERSLKYDPVYALRIITDVGLRRSPLRSTTRRPRSGRWMRSKRYCAAAPLPLGTVRIRSEAGGVVVPRATWSDIVDLGIWEVLEAGLSAPRVTRRVSARLDDLLADLPADRHAPLLRYRRRLLAGVTESAKPQDAARPWLVGDRQGIGGER